MIKQRTFSSEGIILSRRNHGEADRILTVYSKHLGKIRVLAKGVRKPKSKKRGHVEIFSHIKFSISRSHTFPLITEAEIIESFDDLRHDLRKVTVAYYMCEVVNKVMHDEEKNDYIYANFLKSLLGISHSGNLGALRKKFVVDTLVSLGFWPYGKVNENPDKTLEEVVERRIHSFHIGKKILN
jgi:DNA repair protein RecO (recombination protein O)